jgi:FPC/CPF motif-containing protein YcgG
MQPNEKTNDKVNLQASLQANQQPKKTWQEPVLTNLELNGGNFFFGAETYFNINSNGQSAPQ